MVARNLALDLKPRGITSVVVSPGHVRTDMGGPSARLAPEESISALRALIDGLTPEDSGRFIFYNGDAHAW